MGEKLRSQMGIISNMTNAKSDVGIIEYFSTNRTSLETILLSSLTCGSEVNVIEFLEMLPSVNNSETDVQMISRLRSELRSSDCGHRFLFSNFVTSFVSSFKPFLVSSALCITVLLLLERVEILVFQSLKYFSKSFSFTCVDSTIPKEELWHKNLICSDDIEG